MSAKKRGLGRGLDALLGGGNDRAASEPERLRELPIEASSSRASTSRAAGMDPSACRSWRTRSAPRA
jgi:hypothetical protein